MQRFFTFLLLIHTSLLLGQDEIKNFVQQNAILISNISSDSTNYSDLKKIGDAIGNSQIVMLGEQDHGDASTFLAKTRLIKYLHEKKGFNVLAFESDFFGLNYGWDNLEKKDLDIDSFIRGNIFGVWTSCKACSELFFNYVPATYKTNNPLTLTGFDNRMILDYSFKHLIPLLDSELTVLKLPVTLTANYKTEIISLLNTFNNTSSQTDTSVYGRRNYFLSLIKQQMIDKLDKNDFWVQVIENLMQENIQEEYRKIDYWKSSNARDIQMASNLKWLVENKYKNEKIIVWAHNYHISKYAGHYPEDFLNNAQTMGSVFTNDTTFQQKTYVIGFTSYEGTAGRVFSDVYKIEKPKSNSFETWINKEYSFAFVDFKKYNFANPTSNEAFYMSGSIKGNMRHTNHKAQWNKIFDGIFYIKEMYPCSTK